MKAPLETPLHVVAGALCDGCGRLLIAERPAGRHLAGGWEFPGGKLHAAEPREAGLARELGEEIGVRIESARPLIQIRHRYPDRSILLDVWRIKKYSGTPSGREGQRLRWCGVDELAAAGMLPADRPVIAALRLPARLMAASSDTYDLIRPWHGGFPASGRLRGAWCADAGEALAAAAAGAEFLALGDPLGTTRLAALCDAVNVPVFARDIPMAMAWALGATGVNEVMAS